MILETCGITREQQAGLLAARMRRQMAQQERVFAPIYLGCHAKGWGPVHDSVKIASILHKAPGLARSYGANADQATQRATTHIAVMWCDRHSDEER